MQDETHAAVIGPGADSCFTTTINGCSIGLGHESVNGNMLIIHGNEAQAAAPGTAVGQAPAQAAQIQAIAGPTLHRTFRPSSYRVGSKGISRFAGTVVRLRNPEAPMRRWVFETQQYEQVAVVPDKHKLRKLVGM